MRTDLQVPFEQRNAARELGARWDPARKTWFVPDGVDLTPFLCWRPDLELSADVRRALSDPRPRPRRRRRS